MKIQKLRSVDDILRIWDEFGGSGYGGESVTQREHGIQTALLAEQADASTELIAAALLHDFGHLVHDLPDDAPDQGIDDSHENIGDNFLRSLYPESVTGPIRLHVDAKRYLCHIDDEYLSRLSEPSVTSLNLQGGPMTAEEAKKFETNPHWREAVELRKWDDAAKVPDMQLPEIEYFGKYLMEASKKGGQQ